ncbi:MAG: PEP-CTERM-box response regulator transcription factor [Betaproteobacteria bacterium]|nr:PEP-CTERM-box response regulator transcription factor [Betaproteobacteria bacterium]
MEKLLLIEDDPALQKQMRWAFDAIETITAHDAESAIAQIRRHEPAVITLDLGLPPRPDDPTEGLKLLRTILELTPDAKVIVLTGQSDRANALEAIALGAFDFHAKPFEPDLLRVIIDRAFRMHALQVENRRLHDTHQPQERIAGLITQDPETLRACALAEKIAPSDVTVMILGESGTGKELIARACHQLSARRDARFVAINCAAIPENLLESELFGFERGAFTGATRQTPGKIETANRGTLFLDEIGDMPLPLQVKLLRFLQERVIERVGGREEIRVDVRVVCATHQDLKALISKGLFREDLYYRLAEIVISIPPLRARPGDAALIAQSLIRRLAAEQRVAARKLGTDALAAIERQPWTGNVRELESTLRRALILSDGDVIGESHLGLVPDASGRVLNLRQVRDEAEREAVGRAVAISGGNLSRAAEALGISRPTLYELLDRFGMRK